MLRTNELLLFTQFNDQLANSVILGVSILCGAGFAFLNSVVSYFNFAFFLTVFSFNSFSLISYNYNIYIGTSFGLIFLLIAGAVVLIRRGLMSRALYYDIASGLMGATLVCTGTEHFNA